jgi:hypothetical protein
MVDDEGSTLEETCGETRNGGLGTRSEEEVRSEGRGRNLECGNLLPLCPPEQHVGFCAPEQHVGYRVRALACSPSHGILSAGDLLPLCGAQPAAHLELSPRRYHVFARAPDRDAPSTIGQTVSGQLWVYIAPIHRKRDAIAVSAGLVESGLAIEARVCVIAQSPGPRAGKLLIIHGERRPA